jgi:hypothetical protein
LKIRTLIHAFLLEGLFLTAVPALGQGASPTLLKIDIHPGPAFSMEAGKQQQFVAAGVYSDGKTKTFNESAAIVWATQSPQILSIDSATGEAAAVSAGTVWIQATDPSSNVSSRAWITVTEPSSTLQNFYVSPSPVTVAVGESVTLKVKGIFHSANATTEGNLPGTASVEWNPPSRTDADYFSLDQQTGTVTGLKVGSGVFTVQVAGLPKEVPETQIVTVKVIAESARSLDFDGMLTAGEASVSVFANAGDSLEIYQFPDSYPLRDGDACSAQDLSHGTPLILVVPTSGGGGSASTTTTGDIVVLPASGQGPFPITLSQPLTPGHALCFVDRGGSGVSYSLLRDVNDPNDYGRVRSWLITGIQTSNQLASNTNNSSSTAGWFVEFGMASSYFEARDHHPGLETITRFRLSPIPVATTATSTTAGTTPTSSTTLTSTNILSSQNSARVEAGVFMPIRVSSWSDKANAFVVGPMVKAGFGTLLNPSLNNASNSATTGGTSGISSPQFSSAYTFWAVGSKMAWNRYPNSRNEAPQTISAVDVVVGEFSNLPNFVCSQKFPNDSQGGCPDGETTGSRTVIPRVDVEAFAKLPRYPIIFGMEANMQQYKWFTSRRIDPLNKPGNDIRFLFAVDLPLGKLMSVLGVSQ